MSLPLTPGELNKSTRNLDPILLFLVLVLTALGTLTLYSAGKGTTHHALWIRQSVWNGLGLIAMLLFSRFDYRRLAQSSMAIYGTGLLSLLVVLVIGKTVAGSTSWLSLGGVSLQPSEFVKWLTLLFVAHRLGTKSPEGLTNWDLVGAAGLMFFPMFLVLKQPDLGVAMTYTPILLLFPLLRGIRWRWVVVGVLGFTLFSTVVWNYKLKVYQKERILTFIDPSRDLKGKGYQVNQSRIAIGAGGLWGKGYMSGSQTQLNFLPVKTTDFVFSVWAEERGFVGILMALALFGVLLHRILAIAGEATTAVGTYFCVGAAGIFGFHILINIGMVSGAVPTTGIPLPFFTYGGSSTLAFSLALGVIMNIHHQAKSR
jgi:rod shape determining protein RodA